MTADAITEWRRKILERPGAMVKIRRLNELHEKYQGILVGEEIDPGKVAELDGAELVELSNALAPKDRSEPYRLALADGIGGHNFCDDAGKPVGGGETFDKATVDQVLELDVMAAEIFGIVEAYNRPLASRSGRSSGTSSSGSTEGTSSRTTEKPTQTGSDRPS